MLSLIGKWAKHFDNGLGLVSKWAWWVGAIFALLMVLGNTYEVTARYVFNRPSGFMDEILEFAYVGIVFLVLGWAWRSKAHVHIEIVIDRLHGRLRNGVYLAGLMVAFLVLVGMVFAAWTYEIDLFTQMRRPDSNLQTPWFIPMIMIVLGLTIYCLEMLATLVKEIATMFRGGAKVKST